MSSSFDFIIVGGGTAGCVVASRLAKSKCHPSVLLLEAGGENKNDEYLIPIERYTMMAKDPAFNWGYKSIPQPHLNGFQIDASRGRGLGGGTTINFQCWVKGADEDFDEIARITGDNAWSWKSVQERFKNIENYHIEVPLEYQKYISPKAIDHGSNGPVDVSYADVFEKGLNAVFEAAEECGLGINPDINNGNPIGMGLGGTTVYKGLRTTAATAYLQNVPSNLTIVTDAQAAKILTDDKTSIGVETIDGRKFYARKDTILCAGAINTPQLLMLSGIGPEDELQKHGIPIVHDLKHVGKNLKDHYFSSIVLIQNPDANERMSFEADEKAMALAKAQYAKDKTGKLVELNGSTPTGFFKDDAVYNSPEFAALPKEVQERLHKPTIPVYEIVTHVPPLYLGDYVMQPCDSYVTGLNIFMNPQTLGEITLKSSDPRDAPLIDPKALANPYDKRVAIESTRRLMEYLQAPAFAKDTVKMVGCPKSTSDEDIWAHISGDLFAAWHMSCTVMMGKPGDEKASVDTQFRVLGVDKLRVADLSVLPLLPSNHTQSTAYLIGETAAEKFIAEYHLEC